ncbi:MAG: hypothetical protein ACK2U1_19285, partial [Anaerolineales bacterium]
FRAVGVAPSLVGGVPGSRGGGARGGAGAKPPNNTQREAQKTKPPTKNGVRLKKIIMYRCFKKKLFKQFFFNTTDQG